MESNKAAEHIQVIRTLMERSALYRRALAPIMLYAGVLGLLGAAGGIAFQLYSIRSFGEFWLGVAVLAVTGAFVIARRQAIKDREPFWSPPTRRVAQALLPPLVAGLLFSLVILILNPRNMQWLFVFPNVLFYGCALHAAGFFISRGVKLFAWILIVLGCGTLLVIPMLQTDPDPKLDHALMGFFFGILHLACAVYLYFTEKGKNVA